MNNNENILCVLFGHKGNNLESGYHVCSRCGLHEYWNNPEIMQENGIDTMPNYYKEEMLKGPILNAFNRAKRKLINPLLPRKLKCNDCNERKEECSCPPF